MPNRSWKPRLCRIPKAFRSPEPYSIFLDMEFFFDADAGLGSRRALPSQEKGRQDSRDGEGGALLNPMSHLSSLISQPPTLISHHPHNERSVRDSRTNSSRTNSASTSFLRPCYVINKRRFLPLETVTSLHTQCITPP